MNHEQFVYWLSGYLSAMPMSPLIRTRLHPILEMLQSVKPQQGRPLEFYVHETKD